MGKLPENIVLVRMDKDIWQEWCEFCEAKGLLASKWAGFRLQDYMKFFGWKELGTKKRIVDPENRLMEENFKVLEPKTEVEE